MVVVVVFFFFIKIFDNPAEGRLHDAAKPLIYKIFENPAEGRPHVVAKPLIYKIFDNPAEGRRTTRCVGPSTPPAEGRWGAANLSAKPKVCRPPQALAAKPLVKNNETRDAIRRMLRHLFFE